MFGKRVRQLRKKRGLTQEELAARAHLHTNYVSLIERGHRVVSLNTMMALAKTLKVKPAQLFVSATGFLGDDRTTRHSQTPGSAPANDACAGR
jgi:transcriptional regulator with XRE-family HTH domain